MSVKERERAEEHLFQAVRQRQEYNKQRDRIETEDRARTAIVVQDFTQIDLASGF